MHTDEIYLMIAGVVLVLAVIALFFLRKKKQSVSWFTNIALLFIIMSLFFENRAISYPLVAVGIVIAIIDIIRKRRK